MGEHDPFFKKVVHLSSAQLSLSQLKIRVPRRKRMPWSRLNDR